MSEHDLSKIFSNIVLDHHVAARTPWSGLVRKGQVIRIIDLKSQQAVDALFYNAHAYHERYSAQDTLLNQGSAYIGKGTGLYSNEGNVLMTVVDDTCGRHDTLAGACSCESNTVRFGHETKYMHSCRENFLLEVEKYGMSKRDIVNNVNFFMNVPVLQNGELVIDDGLSDPGGYVDLRAEMDTLVVISNCPQVNNPCNGFVPTPIRVVIGDPVSI
ncbi:MULTISPECIES: urea amidolyase associated protein UAAP2 [Acetobacter]|jgi:urea carboxylase-associated protein 1|uniref:urea amidolyase associated protein UAAP2 n=1 Tax=Acetobacter TaxID=434 RepID=UPI00377041F2